MMEPLLILLVLIGTVSYVAWPWLREKGLAAAPGASPQDGPREETRRNEAELEELETDFHAGKVGRGDYEALREELLGRLAAAGPADRRERRE